MTEPKNFTQIKGRKKRNKTKKNHLPNPSELESFDSDEYYDSIPPFTSEEHLTAFGRSILSSALANRSTLGYNR